MSQIIVVVAGNACVPLAMPSVPCACEMWVEWEEVGRRSSAPNPCQQFLSSELETQEQVRPFGIPSLQSVHLIPVKWARASENLLR